MSIRAQSYSFEGLVKLQFVDDYYPPTEIARVELTPDEARLLALRLIRDADDAERPERS